MEEGETAGSAVDLGLVRADLASFAASVCLRSYVSSSLSTEDEEDEEGVDKGFLELVAVFMVGGFAFPEPVVPFDNLTVEDFVGTLSSDPLSSSLVSSSETTRIDFFWFGREEFRELLADEVAFS